MKKHGSLNRIYRIVWNKARGMWIAVCELAKGQGKGGSGRRKLALKGLVLLAPLSLISLQALASPDRGQITSGSGSISQSGATANTLPEMGNPTSTGTGAITPNPNGVTLDSRFDGKRFIISPEYSQQTGLSLGGAVAFPLGDSAAGGLVASAGADKQELMFNAGLQVGEVQRLILTLGQLRQRLEFDFPSGKSRAGMIQNSGGISWRFDFGIGLLDHAELIVYAARTASRDLSDATYTIDAATLYELWSDPRRVAGGRVGGIQGKVGINPWEGGRASLGFGHESLRYDLLAGAESYNRTTSSLGVEQAISRQTRLKFTADAAAAQNRYLVGLDHRFGDLGTLGISLLNLHGRDGAPGDTRVQLSWAIPLGERGGATGANLNAAPRHAPAAARSPAAPQAVQWGGNLLDQVAARPAWMPSQVIAKRDTTAAQTRLVVIDKTALPAGASINTGTGVITVPIGVAVTGIASVTRNAALFVNTGPFALSGNSLVIDPQRIVQPAVGATDVYVVTLSNAGGGAANITINVQRGSVKVVSIVVRTDFMPDAFTFTDVTGQAVGTVVESNAITLAGIDVAAAISVTGGEYQIDGGAWTSNAGTVTVGQTVKVRHTTSASNATATNTVLTIGGVSDTFTTTTIADTTPNAFTFTDVTGQALSAVVESAAITVAGIGAVTAISVTGGEYQIDSGAWTSSAGTVTAGQTVKVRHTTSASNATPTNTVLTIGGVSDTFTTTTIADTIPNAFTFTDVTGQALSTVVESAAITVAGIGAVTAISVTGGEYQIGGGVWTSSAGTVTAGQTVKVRHTTSASNATATNTVLTIGGVSDTFTTTTIADTTPNAFTFTDVTGQALSTVVESAAITVAGIGAATAISVTGGEYQIDGGAWTSNAGTVTVGQTVKVRHTTSASNATATNTVLTIGGVSDTFTTTTIADTTPNAFTFTDVTGQALSTVVESAAITVAGIGAATAISVTGGEYQIDGGAWTSSAGTVTTGQTVKVRHTTSASNATATNTVLTIGGVSDTFTTTTIADTTPNAFTFTDVTGQVLSTVVESAAITVAGIGAVTAISVTGGEYQIDGGAWTSSAGTVTAGQTVKVRHTTSASNATATNTVLTIGGVSDTFTTTTIADTTPNAFTFIDKSGQALSTVVKSNIFFVTGIGAATAISVTGGEYQIDGGTWGSAWTSSAGTVTAGQTVQVRHTTSASYSTATNTVLTIGGVSDTFTTTTMLADTTPNAFTFTDLSDQTVSTLVESNAITVAGINVAANISVTGGEYQINGGAWTSSAGTVTTGQTVKVRHTTSANHFTATNTVLTIGDVSDTFTTTVAITVATVAQGGLSWTKNNATAGSSFPGRAGWNSANTFCSTQTINGQTGWRLPTTAELVSLYNSGAITGQGWALFPTWSSTPGPDAGSHEDVYLSDGTVYWINDSNNYYVTCIR